MDDLENVLSPDGIYSGLITLRDMARARAQLKKRLGGHIIVKETPGEIRFETEARAAQMALGLVSGASNYGSGGRIC